MSRVTSGSSPATSLSLLQQAVDGDASAWSKIVQVYAPLVYKWSRQRGIRPEDAADITQETFSTLATRLDRFRSDHPGATFRGWLWTITKNKSWDFLRARQGDCIARGGSVNLATLNEVQGTVPADRHTTDSPVEDDEYETSSHSATEQTEVIHRAIALLRKRFATQTWNAFWRTEIDGCTPEEVADELGISKWSVYKARSRVLHRLRSELNGLEQLP